MRDGVCGECLEEFHLDDIGGYNPPCSCGFACRSCCAASCVSVEKGIAEEFEPDDFDSDDSDEADPQMPGWMP